jgi:hypothetical protein
MIESKFLRNVYLAPYPTASVPHGVKSLTPWGTAAGAWFRWQGGAARRQIPAAERHDGRSLPPYHTALGHFYFFSFSFLKHF